MVECVCCGDLPDKLVVETGKGETFPPAMGKLKAGLKGISNMRQFMICPECSTYFMWKNIPQVYGSGWLDEEQLTRLSPKDSKLLAELFNEELKDTETFLNGMSTSMAVFALENSAPAFASPDLVRPFLPALAGRIADGDMTFRGVLAQFLDSTKDGARDVRAACKALEEEPGPIKELLEQCRKRLRARR